MLYSSPAKKQPEIKKGRIMKKSPRRPLIVLLSLCGTLAVTIGIVASAWLLSRFMLRIQHSTEKHISVKGVAERTVRSDLGSFVCSVSVRADTVEEGYAALNSAADALRAKLDEIGFRTDEREDENINYRKLFRTERIQENGKLTTRDVFDGYSFTYSLRIRTTRVDVIAENHLKLFALAKGKIAVEVSTPEYFISSPEQYKLALVDEASASASRRAGVVAEKCGSTLGELLTARQGVIQITRPASNDTSDYGVYDTSSIEKVMRLVVTLDFALR